MILDRIGVDHPAPVAMDERKPCFGPVRLRLVVIAERTDAMNQNVGAHSPD